METSSVSFTWNQLTHLQIRQDVDKYVDGPFKCMGKLLSPSGDYLSELKLFKSVSLKLALRLRSSPVTAVLARLLRSLSLLVELQIADDLTGQLDSLLNERIDTRSGKIVIPSAACLTQCLEKITIASSHLATAIEYCTFACGQSMMWLRLGHMNQHFLTLLASISRLSILSKSVLVYSCDLYKGLYLILHKLQSNSFHQKLPVKSVPPSLDHILLQLNLTPSDEPVTLIALTTEEHAKVEEPVLVKRPENKCDILEAIDEKVIAQTSTSSSADTIAIKIREKMKKTNVKHKRLFKHFSFPSPKMKRIFKAFKKIRKHRDK